MSQSFLEKAEEQELFRRKQNQDANMMFVTNGSSGKNPEKLARILITFDSVINALGWQNKPIAKFTNIVTQYQASLNGGYHKDFKDVLISEEIEKRKSNTNGLIISQG